MAAPLAVVVAHEAEIYRATGRSLHAWHLLMSMALDVAAVRLLAGHRSTERSRRGARHNAYSLGLAKPRPRMTRDEAVAREARLWGFQ